MKHNKQYIPTFSYFNKVFDLILEERLTGGNADKLTLKDIAKHHNVSLTHIKKQYDMGIIIEREHTTDHETIDEITKDHLFENPNYYTLIKKVEK